MIIRNILFGIKGILESGFVLLKSMMGRYIHIWHVNESIHNNVERNIMRRIK